jgi:hypothetical protein
MSDIWNIICSDLTDIDKFKEFIDVINDMKMNDLMYYNSIIMSEINTEKSKITTCNKVALNLVFLKMMKLSSSKL